MDRRLRITDVRLVPGSGQDAQNGLLAYLQFTLNQALLVDGVTLRRSRDGRRYLSYPARRGNGGSDYPYLRPLTDGVRQDLERQVLAAIEASSCAVGS